MGANENGSLHQHRHRKKKKSKKSKKLKSKVQHDSQVATRLLNPQNASAKIQDLIKETMANISREKIVQLLMQVRNKAENCYDFEISWWLQAYLEQRGDVNLIEAAYMIVNAGHIYERKVDYLYELIRRSVQSDENNAEAGDKKVQAPKPRRKITRQAVSLHDRLYESEMVVKQFKQVPSERITEILSMSSFKAPSNYFKKWPEYKAWRQNHKKKMKSAVPYSTVCDDLSLHTAMWGLSCIEDFEYDDDLDTKRNYRIFTHHMEHRYNTLVPDINFIMHFKVKDFIEAEEDDIEIKKILDLPAPPTRQWPPFCKTFRSNECVTDLSNIDIGESAEDYTKKYVDLEDIVLEKQCYEIDSDLFRFATEAQKNNKINVSKEELLSMLSASANTTTVESNPIESNSNELVEAVAQDDDSPPADDSQLADDSPQVDDGPHGDSINSVEVTVQAQTSLNDLETPLANSTAESILHESQLPGDETANSLPADSAIVERSETAEVTENGEASTQLVSDESQPVEKLDSAAQLAVDSMEISNLSGEITTNALEEQSKTTTEIESNSAIVEQLASNLMKALTENSPVKIGTRSPIPNTENLDSLQLSPSRSVVIESIEILPTLNPNPPETIAFSDSQAPHVGDTRLGLEENKSELGMKDPCQIISENIKTNIKDQIVIRISIDEGIAFSDLDDIDKAMLSPVVELVDIFNPIKEDLRNIFEIDERYLSLEETFKLPLDMVCKKHEIQYNILKLPESRLKRKINFALPAEFQLYMESRMKRRCGDKSDPMPTKMIRIFKLNEQDIRNIPQTPPATPTPEDDFLGFDEADQSMGNISWNDVLSSTLNSSECKSQSISTPNRTISRDSGIGLSSLAAMDGPDEGLEQTADVADAIDGIIESENPDPIPVASSESGVETINSMNDTHPDKAAGNDISEPCSDGGTFDETDSGLQASSSSKKSNKDNLPQRTYLESSAEFEQNLYEKCSNGVVQMKASDLNLIMDRVQKWHRYLRPILAVSRERHHFDIYQIGTDIMNTFPKQTSPNESPPLTTLGSVMDGHDPTFLSRYFLSMLQLANANNVEIKVENRSTDKPTLLSDVHLKLLNRKRHSVSMEDDIGATVQSSRKRQHSITDDSDSDSECRIPPPVNVPSSSSHMPTPSSSHRKQPTIKLPAKLIPNGNYSSASPNISSSSIHQPTRIIDIMPPSKTSTPCTTVSKLQHRQQMAGTSSTSEAVPFNISSMSAFSPIPSCSKTLQNRISNSENLNVIKISPVSNNSVVSACTNSSLGNSEQSNNHRSTLSISQENIFKNHSSAVITGSNASSLRSELPPFDSIRRDGGSVATSKNMIESINCPSGSSTWSQSGQVLQSYQSTHGNEASALLSSPPKLIRTQEAMSSAKRSRLGHDDLDSGIFSEFSVNESSSMIS